MKASTCFITFLFMAIAIATVTPKSVVEHTGSQIPARLDGEFPTSQARKVVSKEGKDLDTNLMNKIYTNWLKRGGQFSTSSAKLDNAVGEEPNTIDSNLMKHGGLNSEESDGTKHYGGGCISVKKCMKKKVICYHKCVDSSGKEVSEDHVPGLHCTVVCKKCVPNC